uniref:Uncharacterized protein n=1 Tax=Anopheles atroparvus TaxID=41427 RepID=A0AAG5CY74_ANOAO
MWHFTDVPKTRNTRSTTELPIEVTTSRNITHASQELMEKHKFRNQWWPPQNERTTTPATIRYNVSHSVSGANYSSHSSMDVEDSDPSSVHVINGQPVNNVHEFLQQYMNLVYGGQPGNEQRRQFFLDQLCRNATNGRIVLQCKDITGQRKVRSPAKEVQTWNAGQSPNTASDVQRSLLFATTTMKAIQPDYLGGRSCWCFGRTNPLEQQWRGEHK